MTDKEPGGNSNAGSGGTTVPPDTASDMMDKLIEAAQANPALREKFNLVFNTNSGGSKAPGDGPGDGTGDDHEDGIEEGEMGAPPGRYTGGDLEYIEELEQQRAQLSAENEAMRNALSTITTQVAVVMGGGARPGRRGGGPPPGPAGGSKRPRKVNLWATPRPEPGQYCYKCYHPGHLSNWTCPYKNYTAAEARRRSGYQAPPNGAKKPGQKSDPEPQSEPEESESEPEHRQQTAQPRGRRGQTARMSTMAKR